MKQRNFCSRNRRKHSRSAPQPRPIDDIDAGIIEKLHATLDTQSIPRAGRYVLFQNAQGEMVRVDL